MYELFAHKNKKQRITNGMTLEIALDSGLGEMGYRLRTTRIANFARFLSIVKPMVDPTSVRRAHLSLRE